MSDNVHQLKVRCPQCRAMTDYHSNPHRPFCSERCRMLDLGCWADGNYTIVGDPVPRESLNESEKEP